MFNLDQRPDVVSFSVVPDAVSLRMGISERCGGHGGFSRRPPWSRRRVWNCGFLLSVV